MRVAIAFDSVYGNTRRIAEVLADEAQRAGHSVEFFSLRSLPGRPILTDILFVGGPTHMGGMTLPVGRFLKSLDPSWWSIRPIVAFDTYGPIRSSERTGSASHRWLEPGAAGEIQERAHQLGLCTYPRRLRCTVAGLRGPLNPDALDAARVFAREILGSPRSLSVTLPARQEAGTSLAAT